MKEVYNYQVSTRMRKNPHDFVETCLWRPTPPLRLLRGREEEKSTVSNGKMNQSIGIHLRQTEGNKSRSTPCIISGRPLTQPSARIQHFFFTDSLFLLLAHAILTILDIHLISIRCSVLNSKLPTGILIRPGSYSTPSP